MFFCKHILNVTITNFINDDVTFPQFGVMTIPRSCATLQEALTLLEHQRPAETQKDVDSISNATTLPFLAYQVSMFWMGDRFISNHDAVSF